MTHHADNFSKIVRAHHRIDRRLKKPCYVVPVLLDQLVRDEKCGFLETCTPADAPRDMREQTEAAIQNYARQRPTTATRMRYSQHLLC